MDYNSKATAFLYTDDNIEVDIPSYANSISKRILDIIGAIIGLAILSPIMVLVALLIKIEDPRAPVIFKQIRVGKNGRHFVMYKFRSMVMNAEELLKELKKFNEASGPIFKMKDDPRVTRVGKFIRRTSIDELPQLWNVLKGDMSLVGPRPPLPREVEEYNDYQKKRLMVKPGCTGLWQVSGRGNFDFDEMVALDLQYIREQSLWLDLKIILKTVLLLLGDKNAY